MDHLHLIDAIGGVARVAEACDISIQAVFQWKAKGIPKARLQFLALKFPKEFREAKKRGAAAKEQQQ